MIKNNHAIHRQLANAAAALLLGTGGVSASAAIVTEWDFSTSATFTSATFSGASAGNTVSASELSWGRSSSFCEGGSGGPTEPGGVFGGCGGFWGLGDTVDPDFQDPTSDAAFNRSALTIGTPGSFTGGGAATGTVNTVTDGNIEAGDFGLGINLTHWNNPISGFPTLTGGTIQDTLTLTPVAPMTGASVDAPDITFDFRFAETPNGGPCADGTATPCADLFGIVAVPTLNLAFDYLGQEYFASVLLTDGMGGAAPIGTLGDQECAAVSLGSGCQGFRTAESQATTVQFAFAISTTPVFVPAPAPIALFGLGVLGLGLLRRKSRSQAA
ncbi:THxN family PEP-CTERM protein [Congregibacter litoralis]|uniref:PEP-CTERM protein sorting domain protein n=1 Tax=Congregibacter litoralis KT71 TaxID=314285 RepID=A4A579_9GAMM|nr:THxN family PEP-CTERM protein [Congregibacter litoralis]EAQ98950.2 PEP-CTERM protein sorting domain protein [Congregibacter litoralis KT71]